MTRRLVSLLLLATSVTAPAFAQTTFGVGAGFDADADAALVSVQARTARGMTFPVRYNPQFDLYFPGGNLVQLQGNLNVLYDFGAGLATTFTPYIGAGLGVGYCSRSNCGKTAEEGTDVSLGANFLFGAEFGSARTRPFAQIQISTTKNTGAALVGGVLFSL